MRTLNAILCTAAFLSGSALALAQEVPGGLRGLVERTQTDLHAAADFELNAHKQIDRYQKAETQLSDFDRDLTHGHFDKGKLNDSIHAVKDVLQHNTLTPELRSSLTQDLHDLEVARVEHSKP
jgi:hypothetical protein